MTYQLPGTSFRQLVIGPGGIGLCMATHNEFADHARNTQQQDTAHIRQ